MILMILYYWNKKVEKSENILKKVWKQLKNVEKVYNTENKQERGFILTNR